VSLPPVFCMPICKTQEVREVFTEFSGTRQATHIETYSKFKDWSCLQWHNIITNFGKTANQLKVYIDKWHDYTCALAHTLTNICHYFFFKCFVDRASLYSLVNRTNLVHSLFLVYLSISTCFRRLCAHHQEKQLCFRDIWYLLLCGWLSGMQGGIPHCIPDSYPHRINCAPSWFYLQDLSLSQQTPNKSVFNRSFPKTDMRLMTWTILFTSFLPLEYHV
jgi:hypothetical protein